MVNPNLFEDLINTPEIVKTLRKRKKLSQKKLAKRIGISDKTISAYETGRLVPTFETLVKMLYVAGFVLDIKEDIYKTPKKLTIPLSK